MLISGSLAVVISPASKLPVSNLSVLTYRCSPICDTAQGCDICSRKKGVTDIYLSFQASNNNRVYIRYGHGTFTYLYPAAPRQNYVRQC